MENHVFSQFVETLTNAGRGTGDLFSPNINLWLAAVLAFVSIAFLPLTKKKSKLHLIAILMLWFSFLFILFSFLPNAGKIFEYRWIVQTIFTSLGLIIYLIDFAREVKARKRNI